MTADTAAPGAQREGDLVGLVVVSHSRDLARAAVQLAGEMLHGRPVTVEIAAGLDDTTFGTDAVSIKDAIERADGSAGVVVLMDLGSAVLSAELALDLLADPSARDRVTLSPAPIVEGLIVAAVAAAGGAGRAEVASEAQGALLGKTGQLSSPEPDERSGSAPAAEDEVVGTMSITNPHGLHARPAARLVAEMRGLDATVQLHNLTTGAGPVPATSLSRVATLAALVGHEVEVRASGPQADEAVAHLIALAGRRFDEPLDAPTEPAAASAATPAPTLPAAPATDRRDGPLPASPGVAIGPARRLVSVPVDLAAAEVGEPAAEWRRVVESIAAVHAQIEQAREVTARAAGTSEASIFDAHLSLLSDAELLADVEARVSAGDGAAVAWAHTLSGVESEWAELPDPYLRERAADVRAVGDQVLRTLTGTPARQTVAEGVLVAGDLTPAEVAGLDPALVTGIVLAHGSPTAHAAILARARGIPMVAAAGADVLDTEEGATVVLDGRTGELHVDPGAQVLHEFTTRAADLAERTSRHLAAAEEPAVSRDGTTVTVAANVGSVADARAARAAGADEIGLVRTEFLFLGRDDAPSREEQQADYVAIGEAMTGRRVTVRTLDVGGDKPLPYLPMPVEPNPFLGSRGIRLSLHEQELLRTQLRAICEAARRSPVSVMFPMISTVGELIAARQVLTDAAGPAGPPDDLRVGMMVEVPAAALKIETFLPHLDFVSIGTNDLTQYVLAAERGNGAVASLSDPLDPGVLQLIDRVGRAAAGRVDVAVCGESASDDLAVPLLVGLGVRELSVSPSAVPRVKAAVRELDVEQCVQLAQQALTLPGPDEVRALVQATVGTATG